MYEKTLAIRRELSASNPQDVQLRHRAAYAERRAAELLIDLNRPAEACARLSRLLQLQRELYSQAPTPYNRAELAWLYQLLGRSEAARKRRRPACEAYAQARDLYLENQKGGKAEDWEPRRLAEVARHLAACGIY